MPFLEKVTRGRQVPRERVLEAAEHYYHFGGKSPINDQNRELIASLRSELDSQGLSLPIYWGNRNWHPFLADALRKMRDDGVKRALAFVTSAYSSYSGCRQYRENVKAAQEDSRPGDAPRVDKLRVFYNHPGFVAACAQRVNKPSAVFRWASAPTRVWFSPRTVFRLAWRPSAITRSNSRSVPSGCRGPGYCELPSLAITRADSGPPCTALAGTGYLDHLREL